MDKMDIVRKIIDDAENIVFFGGAGVSTASNIPDFRSSTGLYNKSTGSNYPPEYMLSHTFFRQHPDEFANYYKKNLIFPDARPNKAHIALAKWEKEGKLSAVITQNIDGLHQMAGSKNVIEIHGNLIDYYCEKCHREYDSKDVLNHEGIDYCECGGIIRPDVVLYEEPLDMEKYNKAVYEIENADVFIVGGTSLVVYPAAGLLRYYRGDKLILINMDKTGRDRDADYILYGDIAEILGELGDVK
ncbi:MAG: NAD-dependent protein deacylase [Tissierellia bacterium]|nr:NAD-dependent protein deacylase [Tissierellia bacterium]